MDCARVAQRGKFDTLSVVLNDDPLHPVDLVLNHSDGNEARTGIESIPGQLKEGIPRLIVPKVLLDA